MDYKKEAEKILINRFNKRYPHIVDILAKILQGERVCDIADMFPDIKEQSIRNTKRRYKHDVEKVVLDGKEN